MRTVKNRARSLF